VSQIRIFLTLPEFKDEIKLLLVASYIIGEFSENYEKLGEVLNPGITKLSERIQASCISAAFKLFLKSYGSDRSTVGTLIKEGLDQFTTSPFAEIQDIASVTLLIIQLLQQDDMDDAWSSLLGRLAPTDDADDALPELVRPPELDRPVDLFKPDPSDMQYDPDVKVYKLSDILHSDPELRKKPNKRLARQTSTGKRAVVLKSIPVLATATRSLSDLGSPHGAPSALSSSLAKVDLVDTVAAIDATKNAKPMRTDISLQAKHQAQVAAAASLRGEKKSASSPKVAGRRHRSHPHST
jgi:hypothetical protein